MAHVAFADDAAFGVELRHGVGAVPHAVLAADAGVGGVEHDAGDGVFRVGVDRAALEAVGVEAVVAAHGEIVALRVGIGAAFDLADAAPDDVGGVAVLLVAGDLAGAAADALGHVEVEAILFAFFERARGDEARRERGDDLRRASNGRPRSASVMRTMPSLLPSSARSMSGRDIWAVLS